MRTWRTACVDGKRQGSARKKLIGSREWADESSIRRAILGGSNLSKLAEARDFPLQSDMGTPEGIDLEENSDGATTARGRAGEAGAKAKCRPGTKRSILRAGIHGGRHRARFAAARRQTAAGRLGSTSGSRTERAFRTRAVAEIVTVARICKKAGAREDEVPFRPRDNATPKKRSEQY